MLVFNKERWSWLNFNKERWNVKKKSNLSNIPIKLDIIKYKFRGFFFLVKEKIAYMVECYGMNQIDWFINVVI